MSQLEEAKSNISTVVVESESQNTELQKLQMSMEEKMIEIAEYPLNIHNYMGVWNLLFSANFFFWKML